MILRFILIIFFFSPFASAQDQISIDYLNNALKQNYLFIERSLNKSSLNIEESSGKFFFNKSQLIVEILSPYKERYLINETSIEIHDLDLDQTRIMDLNELNNSFINVLIHGIKENSPHYSVMNIDAETIELSFYDQSNPIKFFFNSGYLKLIRYTDSLEIEHGIELSLL